MASSVISFLLMSLTYPYKKKFDNNKVGKLETARRPFPVTFDQRDLTMLQFLPGTARSTRPGRDHMNLLYIYCANFSFSLRKTSISVIYSWKLPLVDDLISEAYLSILSSISRTFIL